MHETFMHTCDCEYVGIGTPPTGVLPPAPISVPPAPVPLPPAPEESPDCMFDLDMEA